MKAITKEVTSPTQAAQVEEKYRVVAPEAMHETFMTDSEEEGGLYPCLTRLKNLVALQFTLTAHQNYFNTWNNFAQQNPTLFFVRRSVLFKPKPIFTVIALIHLRIFFSLGVLSR